MSADIYNSIAQSLREFGYRDVSVAMIRETDEARLAGKPNMEPHGIVSMFARGELEKAAEAGLLPQPSPGASGTDASESGN